MIQFIKDLFAFLTMTEEDVCLECPALGSYHCDESCEHFGTIKE